MRLLKHRKNLEGVIAARVESNEDYYNIARKMIYIMKKNNKCSISAPEVGINKRLLIVLESVYDYDKLIERPLVIINPYIYSSDYDSLTISYVTLDGINHMHYFCEATALAIKNEINHINGIFL